jgi:hypothetical protein
MKIINIKSISSFKEVCISKEDNDFVIQAVYALKDDKDKELPNTQKRASIKINKTTDKTKFEAILTLLKPIFEQLEGI